MKKNLLKIVATLVALAAIGYGFHLLHLDAKDSNAKEYYRLWNHGYKCRKDGVPASANPNLRWQSDANIWLDGWLAADKEMSSGTKIQN